MTAVYSDIKYIYTYRVRISPRNNSTVQLMHSANLHINSVHLESVCPPHARRGYRKQHWGGAVPQIFPPLPFFPTPFPSLPPGPLNFPSYPFPPYPSRPSSSPPLSFFLIPSFPSLSPFPSPPCPRFLPLPSLSLEVGTLKSS